MADDSKKANEDWMNRKWRPAMGWMYMFICLFDFFFAPVFWSVLQFWETNEMNDAFRQWQPLTLQGAGLFHMAMGAVLGIAAWSRGQEKIQGMNNNGYDQNYSHQYPYSSQPSYPQRSTTYTKTTTTTLSGRKGPPLEEEPVI